MGKENTTQKDLEEMLREAEVAPEPGESIKEGKVIHKGSEDLPTPIVRSTMESAGYVYIYDTRTGERSIANRNMLRQLLRIKREDDTPLFTTVKPPFSPPRGTYKCRLHPDDPERERWDEMGFPVCPKSNLNSPYQVRRHMEKRHKAEWAAMEQERMEKETAEDRELQRTLIKSVKSKAKNRG